jgi:hypothetical protein
MIGLIVISNISVEPPHLSKQKSLKTSSTNYTSMERPMRKKYSNYTVPSARSFWRTDLSLVSAQIVTILKLVEISAMGAVS